MNEYNNKQKLIDKIEELNKTIIEYECKINLLIKDMNNDKIIFNKEDRNFIKSMITINQSFKQLKKTKCQKLIGI